MSDAVTARIVSEEPNVDLEAGTSPEQSFEDPGTPSSHGLPKAATRARKKKDSDEEDEDFQPEEVTSKKKKATVHKEYANTQKERGVTRKICQSTAAKRGIPPLKRIQATQSQARQNLCPKWQGRKERGRGQFILLVVLHSCMKIQRIRLLLRHQLKMHPLPSKESLGMLIRLQRIYNFLLFHAIILSILDVLYAFICYFISFFGTNLLT